MPLEQQLEDLEASMNGMPLKRVAVNRGKYKTVCCPTCDGTGRVRQEEI